VALLLVRCLRHPDAHGRPLPPARRAAGAHDAGGT
jgi:hypothetical protein